MRTLCLVSALAVLMLFGQRAAAHALGAECKLHSDKVVVEAYYSDDTAARAAAVTVEHEKTKSIAQGRTDKQGMWSFPRPKAGRYTVVVDAGAGHRTQVKITVPPLPGEAAAHQPVTITTGESRDEFTRFPWLKAGIGIATIVILSFAWWASRRMARARAA